MTTSAAPPAHPGPDHQVLIYSPDGPLGGTFTCSACAAQAWQPDLLVHAPHCPYRATTLQRPDGVA